MRHLALAIGLTLAMAAPVVAQSPSADPMADYLGMLSRSAVDVCDAVVLQLQTSTGIGLSEPTAADLELLDSVRSACFTTLNNLGEGMAP